MIISDSFLFVRIEETSISDPELFGGEEEGQPSLQGQPQAYTPQQKSIVSALLQPDTSEGSI